MSKIISTIYRRKYVSDAGVDHYVKVTLTKEYKTPFITMIDLHHNEADEIDMIMFQPSKLIPDRYTLDTTYTDISKADWNEAKLKAKKVISKYSKY